MIKLRRHAKIQHRYSLPNWPEEGPTLSELEQALGQAVDAGVPAEARVQSLGLGDSYELVWATDS